MKNGFEPVPVNDCFHIYSNGTNVNSLFTTREDNIFIMNALAVNSFISGIRILVHQIMETHFHLIASGTQINCYKFVQRVTPLVNRLINRHGRSTCINGKFQISMDPIHEARELKNKIMYVYRNAIAARMPVLPWEYEWGPGNIYFVDHSSLESQGKPISALSLYQQRLRFHSHIHLPQNWRINDEGLILPHCYIDWRRVEKEFGTPFVFVSFMHQTREEECRLEAECSRRAVEKLSEAELRKEVNEYVWKVYGRRKISDAIVEERIASARHFWSERRTYSPSTLSRVVLIDLKVLKDLLNIK